MMNDPSRFALLALLAAACGESQTSSSSHFVQCEGDGQCLGVAGAVACDDGRCVDDAGDPVEVESPGPIVSSSGDAKDARCEPTTPIARPLELGTVRLIAEAADGTFYVSDEGEGGLRLFRSHGSQLLQLEVAGSGQGSGGVALHVVTDDGGFALTYEPEDAPTRAVLYPDVDDDDAFERMPEAFESEPLTLRGPSALDDFEVGALVSPITVEYHAVSDQGHRFVAVRPEREWAYEDFRVFFTDAAARPLAERRVIEVSRARDGGSTHLEFLVDGGAADAFFPVVFDGETFAPGDAVLTLGKRELELERSEDPLRELDFLCFPDPPNGWTEAAE